MNYYELTDNLRAGDIIREDGRRHYRFVFGPFQWERTTLFQAYITVNTPFTNQYRPISEAQAQKRLMEQGRELSELLKLADAIAEKGHAGQLDKAGRPYIDHPRTVAEHLQDWEEKIVALLHDLCEDTPWTVEDLARSGIPPKLCAAVDLMTHRPEDSYGQYLTRLRQNRIARNVKLMDLSHNMDLDRIPNPTERDRARVEQYKRARQFLYGDTPSFDEDATEAGPKKRTVSTLQISQRICQTALGGQKVPHGVSHPVLRWHMGQICLAFFVCLYRRTDLQNGKVSRPVRWIMVDWKTGAVLADIPCSREDFPNATENSRFTAANPKDSMPNTGISERYALLDQVLRGVEETGQVDWVVYRRYMKQMLCTVPPAFHCFYRELSMEMPLPDQSS